MFKTKNFVILISILGRFEDLDMRVKRNVTVYII